MSPSIFIDSSDSKVTYGTAWTGGNELQVAGGSYNSCRTDVNVNDPLAPTKMSFSFTGTGVEIFGQPSDDLRMNYTFDYSRSREADLDFEKGVSGKTGVSIFKVSNVTFGYHTISLIPTAGKPTFDYAVVTPLITQSVYENILIADDTDPMIHYNGDGGWSRDGGNKYSGGRSYNDTRVGTDRKGDKFTINFVGASIGVYGMVSHQPGSVSSTYSIDGATATGYSYSYSSTAPDGDWALHQKFFYKEVIPGNHTLVVTVTDVTGGQKYWMDYITFEGTSNTRLAGTPSTTSSSGSSSSHYNWTKLIIGLVGGGLACCLVWACIRRKVRQSLVNLTKSHNSPPGPTEVEVPRPPMMLRRPPHLQSAPPYEPPLPAPPMPMPSIGGNMPYPHGPTFDPYDSPSTFPPVLTVHYSTSGFTGPAPQSGPPPTPPQVPVPPPSSPPFPTPSTSAPATALSPPSSPPAATPSPPAIAPPATHQEQPSEQEVANMQREIERLRVENERIRAQTQNRRQNTAESDGGPADAPPPYNDANYIS